MLENPNRKLVLCLKMVMLEQWQFAKNKGWLSKWGKEEKVLLHFTQTLSPSVANFLPEGTQKNPLHS